MKERVVRDLVGEMVGRKVMRWEGEVTLDCGLDPDRLS